MWDDRISLVRAFADALTDRDVEWALELCHREVEFFSLMAQLDARPYRGHAGIRRYFRDVDATWDQWRVEVDQLVSAPDGRVVIVTSTHTRGSRADSHSHSESQTCGGPGTRSPGAPLDRDPAEPVRAIDKG